MFEVDGQTAIVTGAANGIGEVISRRLANAGARVAIADIDDQAAAAAAERIGKHAFPVWEIQCPAKGLPVMEIQTSEICGRRTVDPWGIGCRMPFRFFWNLSNETFY